MSKQWCALINDQNEIVEQRVDIDCVNSVTKSGFKWLNIIDDEMPSYNPDTHYVIGPNFIVDCDCVRKSWTIVKKTLEEIDSNKINKISAIDPIIFDILLYLENKTRQTPLSKEQFKDLLKDTI